MTTTPASDWLLVVRLRQLGDVLASLEVLRALKAHRPERRTALVVNGPYAELIAREPYLDRVLTPPRGGGKPWLDFMRTVRSLSPAAAIDLHGSARAALITRASGAPLRVGFDVRVRRRAYTVVEARAEWRNGERIPQNSIVSGWRVARHVGCADVLSLPPALALPEAARVGVRARLEEAGVSAAALARRSVVGINPGRPVPSKLWPSARFIELARRLLRDGHDVLVFWGPGEEMEAAHIAREAGAVMAPALSLPDMLAALSWCGVLVTIDSGLKHLAVCARTPTVTLFGPTDPREWHMGSAQDVPLWKGYSCSPCRRLACPFGTTPCMDIDIDEVLSAVVRVTREPS